MWAEDPTSPTTAEGQDGRGNPGAEGTQWSLNPVCGLEGLPEEVTLQSSVKAASLACTRLRVLPEGQGGTYRVESAPALRKALQEVTSAGST